ncbi:MAG TPA: uracil-DNA glycosylase family protein [Gemmatimonadales bacterium]|nr:uracil-DNA glycosylase family protein [Gemmatimonadales bacterium]
MAGEWERYLRQQIEIGGVEVVLSRAVSRSGGQSVIATDSSAPSPVEVGESLSSSSTPISRPTDRPPARPSWRKGAPPIPGPGLAVESPSHGLDDELVGLETLEAVAERIRTTYCCALCPQRTNAVPGEGNPHAKLFLVGEGPGATEDAQGRPFVGQAGNLLNGILEAIEVPRDTVYITNIVKCRPPQNRKPLPDEIAACIPYLHRQIEIIKPKVILALGSTSAEAMLGVRKSLGELRGKVHTYNGIPLIVTYHPAALLRNPNWKKPTWDDVRIARQLLDR